MKHTRAIIRIKDEYRNLYPKERCCFVVTNPKTIYYLIQQQINNESIIILSSRTKVRGDVYPTPYYILNQIIIEYD